MQWILSRDDILGASEQTIGGKAKNLAWMLRLGFAVPPFFVISTVAFAALKEEALSGIPPLNREMSLPELLQRAREIREKIKQATLPREFQAELRAHLNKLPAESGFFALRSSAVGEDGQDASFAGQMDSFLFLKTEEQIHRAILDCMASAYGDRVLQYRLERQLSLVEISTAAICQVMIESDRAGVVFSAHPAKGSRDEYLVSVCWGLGEGVVSGLCNADEFSVQLGEPMRIVDRQMAHKDQAVRFDRLQGFGVKAEAVVAAQQNIPCLSDIEILEVARIAQAITHAAACPQDIEFGFVQERLYVFQTRPITSLPCPPLADQSAVVWDNSNIQESYCGVTTPLTFSFASRAYRFVYQNTGEVLGAKPREVSAQEPVLRNLLGLIRGKVYYNINHWYLGLSHFPSFGNNKADMERMMGLEDPIDFIVDQKLRGWHKLRTYSRATLALLRLLVKFMQIKSLVRDFAANFAQVYASIDRRSLYRKSLPELFALTQSLESSLTKRWSAPIINDFYVMMMNGSVHRQLKKFGFENTNLVVNNLLSGEEGIESTEPTKFLLRLCEAARSDAALHACLRERKNSELMPLIHVGYPAFYAECQRYIELYGDRTIGELKLESITLREDPAFMFACLKNYLDNPQLSLATLQKNELTLRSQEEEAVYSHIQKKGGRLARRRFDWDLRRLREAVKNRENMRLARTRAFGLCRSVFLEMGKQLALYKQLLDARDIFYLTVEEIEQFFEGRAVTSDLKALVEIRKREWGRYTNDDLPHHFRTLGSPYFGNSYAYKEAAIAAEPGAALQGIGCYPGIVEAQIRLIFSPDEELSLQGRILCTVRTDPGWAPLFPSAAGILVERGSSLSHSAVVARELGIPAVVNVPGLTRILRDGEWVRMNGQTGRIERLGDR